MTAATGTDWVVAIADIELVAVSGVRVGGGAATADTETDAPLLRYPNGSPVLPGSSLKGVLRSGAEALLRTVDIRLACDVLSDTRRCLAGTKSAPPNVSAHLCWTCRLFGNPLLAGRVRVEDFPAPADAVTFVRDGVAIDRAELKVADRKKFDYEVVAPGTHFTGRIAVDSPAPEDLGLLDALLGLLDSGLLTVGGGRSRGLGRVRLAGPVAWRELSAATFDRDGPRPVETEVIRRAFAARLEEARR